MPDRSSQLTICLFGTPSYVRSGSPGLARRHYQQFERTLRQELGIAPAPQTQATLLIALEQQRIDQYHAIPSPAFAPSTSFWLPFVGRDEQLAQLQAIAQTAVAGRGAAVLLQGAAGIGKSRLVDELLATLAAKHSADRCWTLLQGRCSPFDSILAYGTFREAFQHLLPDQPDANCACGDALDGASDDAAVTQACYTDSICISIDVRQGS
jgi:hypothetical protein